MLNFLLVQARFKGNKEIWPAHVAVILRNLIFQNHVVPKSVPRKFGKKPVILMGVSTPLREDDVWVDLGLHFFEKILHLDPVIGKKTVAKILENYVFFTT